jgi:hypothetical protein
VAISPNEANSLTLSAGQSTEIPVVAVCLNYGIPTPTPRDRFELVTVEDYSTDPRIRKALKSLATHGTSVGVAQAAMWRVCNDVPFAVMTSQANKVRNSHEVALAAKFVEALDASADRELVDPAYLQSGRLFVRIVGEGALAREAVRLTRELDGLHMMGLPVQTVTPDVIAGPALQLNVEPSSVNVLDAATLVRAVERSVASSYVNVKPARRSVGLTTFRVENRLPFTLGKVIVRAGQSAGSPTVELSGLGVAPARSGMVQIPAPNVVVEGVEFNGL